MQRCCSASIKTRRKRASSPSSRTRTDGPFTKEAVVKNWQEYLDPLDVNQSISGHSARRSGAKTLAKLGWSLWMIQFFGRWAGEMVRGYVEEAYAELSCKWAVQASQSETSRAETARCSQELSWMK